MKVTVIGGSGWSTPLLVSYLANHRCFANLQMILASRNARRLRSVFRACSLIAGDRCGGVSWVPLDDPRAWRLFSGSAVFLIQLRSGGYIGRSADETFPLRYDVCGDEGLGPGGLSAAIRNWRAIRPILDRIHCAGGAPLVVLLSSPVSLLTRAAARTFPGLRVVGICELPWTTLLAVIRKVGVNAPDISFDYLGVNHLGWFYRMCTGGRDIIDEYASVRQLEGGFPSGALIRQYGGVPLKYLRLHFEAMEVLGEQRAQSLTRGEELNQMARSAMVTYRYEQRRRIGVALAKRLAPWYSYAVGPLIASLAGECVDIPFFLSVRNAGSRSDFRSDDILELPHSVRDGVVSLIPSCTAPPRAVVELTSSFLDYERYASEAILTEDPMAIEAAVSVHPWLYRVVSKDRLVREIMEHSRASA